jgi:hypothetical protein
MMDGTAMTWRRTALINSNTQQMQIKNVADFSNSRSNDLCEDKLHKHVKKAARKELESRTCAVRLKHLFACQSQELFYPLLQSYKLDFY